MTTKLSNIEIQHTSSGTRFLELDVVININVEYFEQEEALIFMITLHIHKRR